MVDLFLVYSFIRRLSTPFDEWTAYDLGIIDADGKILIKRKDLRRQEERKAFGVFDLMVLNLKKLLEKVPGGKTRLASYAAALFLLREWNHFTENSLLNESVSDAQLLKSLDFFILEHNSIIHMLDNDDNSINEDLNTFFEQRFKEEGMTAGSGAIAGIGVGAQGEPGITKAQQARYKSGNKKKKNLRDIIGIT